MEKSKERRVINDFITRLSFSYDKFYFTISASKLFGVATKWLAPAS